MKRFFFRNFLEKAISIERKAEYLGEKVRDLAERGEVKNARTIALEALQVDAPSDSQVLLGALTVFRKPPICSHFLSYKASFFRNCSMFSA